MASPQKPAGKEPTKETKTEGATSPALDQGHERLAPDEEASLLKESNEHKTEANAFFAKGNYDTAINKYDEAYAVLPSYLDYELAVLQSNISACHLKLSEWKDAIKSATRAIEGLDRLTAAEAEDEKHRLEEQRKADEVEEEIVSAGATAAAPAPPSSSEDAAEAARRKRTEDVQRIRAKALMRRARARSEQGGWSNLGGAEEDYKVLAGMKNLSEADRRIVTGQLRVLPARVKAAQEKETAEMWGKLKDLGNGILKPFGLSTENFQMKQDPATGGYSMNFAQK